MAHTCSTSEVRFTVVQDLQTLLQKLPPGSMDALVAEHAIDLALNPERQAPNVPYLYRNVIRNARYTIVRSRANGDASVYGVTDDSLTSMDGEGGVPDAITQETPEQVAIATELDGRFRESVKVLDPHAERCYDGLLFDETEEETAEQIGIPKLRVKRLRTRIRSAARLLIGAPKAASDGVAHLRAAVA